MVQHLVATEHWSKDWDDGNRAVVVGLDPCMGCACPTMLLGRALGTVVHMEGVCCEDEEATEQCSVGTFYYWVWPRAGY